MSRSSRIDPATKFHEAQARFDWLEAALPPRHVRSEAQVELQQFSTPPMLAWVIAKAAAISAQDRLLEPSAGNGAFALWSSAQMKSLVLNEIDAGRRENLRHIFPEAMVSAHDGELIADLYRGPVPSVVLMNPPFARSQERGKDGNTAQRHLRSAIRASGPVAGFEAKDAPASAALAEFAGSLDESWRAGKTDVERFEAFRTLSDEARSAWLGHVVSRTLVASLACEGDRSAPLHEAIGALLEVETAHWWRPTAANYFDRVAKAKTLEALDVAGGPELVSRYAASKKAELASAAERIFSGNFIGEPEVKERAQVWVPSIMRFTDADVPADLEEAASVDGEAGETLSGDVTDEIAEQAA